MRLPLLALALAAAPAAAQWDDARLRPFTIDHRAAAESPADVSFLLDAPAGKHGFVTARGGHLVLPNGTRLRLWGVHLTDWSRGSVLLPSKADAPTWARTLARFGVNCVRLHFLDLDAPRGIIAAGADSRHFDAEQLDRLDFLVAELKRRGIYVDLNLNVGRSYRAGDEVRDFDRIRWAKGLVLYDERLIALQKEYARMLLGHVNPYTGRAYRDEPAVALVELLNENGLWAGFQAPTPYYDSTLTAKYHAWLRAHRPDLPPDLPRLRGAEVASASAARRDAEAAFVADVESSFYTGMARFLRDSLGVRVPIAGTADHSHSGSSYPMLASLAKLDVLDGHVYWQHPGSPPPVNTPMVRDPLHSTVVQLARTAVAGKPYTVSEFNHPFPNDWAAEGIPILAAYGALQDWDAIMLYTFEPKRDLAWAPYVGDPFDISLDPVRMTQVAAGALTFLRGDVRPARELVARTYTEEQVQASRRLPSREGPLFTPGVHPSLPLRHRTRIASFDGPPTQPFAAPDSAPIVSDTRELAWYAPPADSGLVTIDTDRTQALIGFRTTRAVRHLAASLETPFAALVLSSLDGRPIADASRMLLSAGSRVSNTNLRWNAERTRVLDNGGPPSLIEPVTGTVTLRGLAGARGVTVQALDGVGRPLGTPARATRSDHGWSVRLGEPVTTWYVVTVTR